MVSLANLSVEELKILAEARKVGGYENMSQQQLENIFIMPSAPTPTLRSSRRSKNCTPTRAPRAE